MVELGRSGERKFLLFTVTIAICFSLFVLTIISSLYVVFGRRRIEKNGIVEENTHFYSYLHVDPDTNERTYGIGGISKELNPHEFISYKDSHGHLNLIYDLGDREFLCTGSCYCEDDYARRVSSVLKRSFQYLVAALSTATAMNQARNYLSEDCENEFDETTYCPNGRVLSEIDVCLSETEEQKQQRLREEYFELLQKFDSIESLEFDDFPDLEKERKNPNDRVFACRGHCMANPQKIQLDGLPNDGGKAEIKFFKDQHDHNNFCENLVHVGKFTIQADIFHQMDEEFIKKKLKLNKKGMNDVVLKGYLQTTLHPFCIENSKLKHMKNAVKDENGKPFPLEMFSSGDVDKVSFCVGYSKLDFLENKVHRRYASPIECKRIQ